MLDAKQILPPLRRKDREITGDAAIENILDRCDVCRIALNGPEGYPYIVPLNFCWEKQDGAYVFYFHCAKAGTKLDLLRADGRCALELDAGHKLLWVIAVFRPLFSDCTEIGLHKALQIHRQQSAV